MLLGPTSSGNYVELIAQGITAVTGKFPKYDLTAANEEAQQSTDLHPGTPLPTYVGGERVGLLIGLKCPEIEPICVFTLPSGIGLYKSQFKDIFGSYYCYGGPHESFTEINNKFHGNVNHFNIFFTDCIPIFRDSSSEKVSCISCPFRNTVIPSSHSVYIIFIVSSPNISFSLLMTS